MTAGSRRGRETALASTYTRGSCRLDELPLLVELANLVFRGRRPGDMGREYPLVFEEPNLEQLRIARAGAEIVSHVGISLRDASVLGAPIRVASIGAVCTHPDHRGHGLASDLMDDAVEHSRAAGASLMLISGGRGLYHRLGYVEVGEFIATSAASLGSVSAEYDVAPIASEDVPGVIALHQAEPVRFFRTRSDWDKLIAAGRLMNQAADLLVVRRAGTLVAYAGVQRPAEGASVVRARVREIGGSRSALAAALPAIAARFGATEADAVALAWDREWEEQAAARGWTTTRVAFPGTLGVIDPERFLAAMRPLLDERSGGAVTLAAHGTGGVLTAAGETVRLETTGMLTALLFGGNTEEARALPPLSDGVLAALRGVLPLPLLWYGYNYV